MRLNGFLYELHNAPPSYPFLHHFRQGSLRYALWEGGVERWDFRLSELAMNSLNACHPKPPISSTTSNKSFLQQIVASEPYVVFTLTCCLCLVALDCDHRSLLSTLTDIKYIYSSLCRGLLSLSYLTWSSCLVSWIISHQYTTGLAGSWVAGKFMDYILCFMN